MTLTSRIAAAVRAFMYGNNGPAKPDPEPAYDPLDPLVALRRGRGMGDSLEEGVLKLRSALEDVIAEEKTSATNAVSNSVLARKTFVGDSSDGNGSNSVKGYGNVGGVPEGLLMWYASQGFIGWQVCAIIAQHWLVNKACSQAGEDATRHGYEISVGDGSEIDSDIIDRIKEIDEDMDVLVHLANMSKFANVFGIRVCIFDVEYDDPKAHEKPFNIDGVKKNSYKGIRQVDPYWCAPILDTDAASNPSSPRFYRPTWWVIGGKKYHWTHLFISMGPEVADVLKPSYYYGGIPLTQRIYERVYAAERVANEAPLLSMSKRTTALHVDIKKATANQAEFEKRLAFWVANRDNHGVKVLGLEENMEESDTSLSDFDAVMMGQYQLVAAVTEVPATKLLGTSPKGFNATGEFEMKSYHEKLETIQTTDYNPFLARHYELLVKSEGWDIHLTVAWNPVDSKTAEQLAELNERKATTGKALIEGGVISPDEERQRVRNDKNSGYTLDDEVADTDMEYRDDGGGEPPSGGDEPPGGGALDDLKKSLDLIPDTETEVMDETALDEAPGSAEEAPVAPDAAYTEETVATLTNILGLLRSMRDKKDRKGPVRPSVIATAKPSVTPSASSALQGVVPELGEGELEHSVVGDITIAVENEAGSYRSGEDEAGNKWRSQMPVDYGYIVGTKGADGHEMDVFVGPDLESDTVFVVNQKNPHTGVFDEHKCMVGFGSIDAARDTYMRAYSRDWQGLMSVEQVDSKSFCQWLKTGDTSKPFEPSAIKTIYKSWRSK